MTNRLIRFVAPALIAAAVPTVAVLAQTQGQPQPPRRGPSPETLARLQDGRIAMIKEALKLNDAQLKLWPPVEQQLRAAFAARQQARAERRESRQGAAERSPLPDRLDRASQRMTQRAERIKALSDAVRPLYASLSDDQKAVAAVVLRPRGGMGRFHGRRWAMHRHAAPEQK